MFPGGGGWMELVRDGRRLISTLVSVERELGLVCCVAELQVCGLKGRKGGWFNLVYLLF